MVTTKQKVTASTVSALIVGLAHGVTHTLVDGPNEVYIVGSVVVLTVFAVAYWGMSR